MNSEAIEVSEVIDRRGVGPFQVLVIALCAAVVFMEGFNAQSVGYVAPSLAKVMQLKPEQLGLFFSVGLLGLMLGALLIAPLADRVGRRPVIIASTWFFGLCSLATLACHSIGQLDAARFLTGLGLGGAMPNAIALTSEYSPAPRRSMMVVLMFNGFTLGSIAGGLTAVQLVPTWGWQSVFLVGGVLPLLLTPALLAFLPESIRLLVVNGAPRAKVAALVGRVDPALATGEELRFRALQPSGGRMSVRELFAHGRALRTVVLWVLFFTSLLDLYLLVNWLPTTMAAAGASLKTAAMVGVVLQLGGVAGSVLGWLLDKIGPRNTMAPVYLLAAVCIALIGAFATHLGLVMAAVFGAGFGVIGGQVAANAIAATSYPTEIRSTGVGWSLGVGRLGSILGPALGGMLLSAHIPLSQIFYLSAIPALIAAAAALGLGVVTRTPATQLGAAPEAAGGR